MKTKSTDNTFFLTLRHEIIENKKALLLGVGAIWGVFILFGALMGYWGRGGGKVELVCIFILMSLFSSVAGSLTFSNMKTKQGRISMLMIPSTAFDKFIVRWIGVVPVLIVILTAGMYLCDLTRIFVCWLCDNPRLVNSPYMEVINVWQFFSRREYGVELFLWIISGFMFNQAVYIFGSILWPKLSFLKTFIAAWCWQMMLGFTGIFIQNNRVLDRGAFQFAVRHEDELVIGWIVLQVILTFTFYALTYWRFKRSQVHYKLF